MRERSMDQNHIRSKSAKLFRELLTGILAARCSLPAAVALGVAVTASLSPGQRAPRNIRGACRGKAIFIASIKLRSNVSGRPLASAAARGIRVYFSRTSRAIPARDLQARPKPIEPNEIDASLRLRDGCLLMHSAGAEGQHEVTQDHSGRPIILGRIR
jgi:hypothetical protein